MLITAHLAIKCLMANYSIRCREIFKGLSHDGGQADFSKETAAPLPLNKIYRMSQILAESISLDSTFNDNLLNEPNFCMIHLAGQLLDSTFKTSSLNILVQYSPPRCFLHSSTSYDFRFVRNLFV